MQMMNWNDLKLFLSIAEHGTLAGAARALGHNHSTVFRRLNALEKDINTRLFDRQPSGYLLTPAGERLLELARDADQAVQKIELEIAGRDLSPTGTVRVTSAPNIAHTIIPHAIKALRTSHPGILVEVSTGDTDYDLNRREADIALRATPAPPEHLIGRRIANLDWWVCAGSGKRKIPQSAEQVADQPVIGADAQMMRLSAFQWLERQFSNNIVARANDLTTMACLARRGVGLAVLPSDQFGEGLKTCFRVPSTVGELWLLTHPDLRNVQRIKVVWQALEQAVHDTLGND